MANALTSSGAEIKVKEDRLNVRALATDVLIYDRSLAVGSMRSNANEHELILLDQAGQALAEARTLDEIKDIRDKAEAVRKYAASASLGLDVQNRAAEVKLRAERQAGKLLAQLALRGGDRRSKGHHDRLKLDDLGLTANQSKRWQLQSLVPENLFRAHVSATCDAGKELTSAGLMRLAKRLKEDDKGKRTELNGALGAGDGEVRMSLRRQADVRRDAWKARSPAEAFDEALGELRNHHQLLNDLLEPVFAGRADAVRPAELRMMRYLMHETSALLSQLGELKDRATGGMRRPDRAAL